MRDLEPEVLVGYAHRPIVGEEKIRDTLNAYLDGIAFMLDQSLRLILGGYGPEDLRHMIRMPEYLSEGERIKVDTRSGEFLSRA